MRAQLERHLTSCLAEARPEHSFALNVDGLLDPRVTFGSYLDRDMVLGVAAIMELDASDAEVKSVHTLAETRLVAFEALSHLLDAPTARGYQ